MKLLTSTGFEFALRYTGRLMQPAANGRFTPDIDMPRRDTTEGFLLFWSADSARK